jgi:enamine deaminase RidA (YjgF/YER057c/UK114 family)
MASDECSPERLSISTRNFHGHCRIETLRAGADPAGADESPAGLSLPFEPVNIIGSRAIISGHGPQNADGSFAEPLGKVGSDLSVEQGYAAARQTALSILASLKRALGDLDHITAWVRVFGMVNSAAGFNRQPAVINGFSDLILEVFGPAGTHARSAVGLYELPFNFPVEIEGEVEIR